MFKGFRAKEKLVMRLIQCPVIDMNTHISPQCKRATSCNVS
jgi:hypothetical protein